MPFSINLDPILVSFGPLQIRYYGIVFVLGFLVTLWALLRAVKIGRLDMNREDAYDFIFYALIGIIIGARTFHIIFWGLDYFLSDPLKIFYIWEGGLSFHGGLVGGFFGGYIFSKRKKISFWKLADVVIIPAVFMQGLGRISNFINQELLGTITQVPWCVRFLQADPLNCRHPVQLYGAIGRFAAFFFLIGFKEIYKPGYIFWHFVMLLGIGRLLIDFLREDIAYLGLSAGQWLSVLMILFGLYVLFKFFREDLKFTYGSIFKKKTDNN